MFSLLLYGKKIFYFGSRILKKKKHIKIVETNNTGPGNVSRLDQLW